LSSLCFLCIGKAYLNMNLQYGCAHNFSCANKNLFRTILLYFKSFSDQSIYLRPISPTIPFFSQDLQVTSSQQGSQEARSTLARLFSPKKGSSSKLSPNKPPFTKLYSITKLYSGAFSEPLYRSRSRSTSSARFPKSSSKDLIGTKSPSTYLCLNLTSLWLVKWPKPINVWQKTIHPM